MFAYPGIFEWLVRGAIGSLLVLLVGAAVLLVREPARRVRVIQATLVACLAVPWLPAVPGLPSAELFVTPQAERERGAPSPSPGVLTQPTAPSTTPAWKGQSAAKARKEFVEGQPVTERHEAELRRQASVPPLDYRTWIVSAYLAGVGLMLAKRLVGAIGLWRLVRRSREADADCRAMLESVAGREPRRLRLLISDRAAQPFTFTWLRPTIVLPSMLADGHDPQALRWCLAHEWAHVERRDAIGSALASLVLCLYFYQPLAWWLRRKLRLAQDHLADARAAGQSTAEDYAEFLTHFAARLAGRRLSPGLGITSGKSDLYRRVVMLLNRNRPLEQRSPRWWNALVLFAAVSLLLAVGAVTKPSGTALADEPKPADSARAAAQPAPTSEAKPDEPVPPAEGAPPLRAGTPKADGKVSELQLLLVEISFPQTQAIITGKLMVEPDGDLLLPEGRGRVRIKGLTFAEAEQAVAERFKGAKVQLVASTEAFEINLKRGWKPGEPYKLAAGDALWLSLAANHRAELVVQPGGELPLGATYGKVQVAGLTIADAEKRVSEAVRNVRPSGSASLTFAWKFTTSSADLPADIKQLRDEVARLRTEVAQLGGRTPDAGTRTTPAMRFPASLTRERVYAQIHVEPPPGADRAKAANIVQDFANKLTRMELVQRIGKRPEVVALPVMQRYDTERRGMLGPSFAARILPDLHTIEVTASWRAGGFDRLPTEQTITLVNALVDEFFAELEQEEAQQRAQLKSVSENLAQLQRKLEENRKRLKALDSAGFGASSAGVAVARKITEAEMDDLVKEVASARRQLRAKQREFDEVQHIDVPEALRPEAIERRRKQIKAEMEPLRKSAEVAEAGLKQLVTNLDNLQKQNDEYADLQHEVPAGEASVRKLEAQAQALRALAEPANRPKVTRLKAATIEESK